MNIAAWMKQPTTVGGIAGLAGVLTGVLSGAMSAPVAAASAVGAIVAMVLPDNTQAVAQSKIAATDLANLAQTLAPLLAARPAAANVASIKPGNPAA